MEVIKHWTLLEGKTFVIVDLNSAQFLNQWKIKATVVGNRDSVKCSPDLPFQGASGPLGIWTDIKKGGSPLGSEPSPITSCVTLGKLLNFSESQFPHLVIIIGVHISEGFCEDLVKSEVVKIEKQKTRGKKYRMVS